MQKSTLSFIFGILLGGVLVFTLYQTLFIEFTTVTYLPDGGTYTGERKGDLFHGKGRLEWPDGSVYKGDFQNGVMTGQGILHLSDGSVYEGEFKTGMLHGKGVYRYKVATYTGEFEKDLFHGQGEHIQDNGDRYVGEFKEGYYHGQGDYIASDKSRYTGEFVEGAFTGRGTFLGADGSTFEGVFKDWMYDGEGVYTDANGDKYTGDHSEGALNGEGEYIAADGSHYKGDFQYGLYQGEGEYKGADGSHYKGNFESGYYSGEGELTAENGDHYVGNFWYGGYQGKGTLTYAEPQDGIKTVTGTWEYGTLASCEGDCSQLLETTIVEAALYNQNQLLDTQLNALQENNSDQIDMYFLGVAGHGSQAVFRREVLFVKDYFDTHLNTKGASVTLINDRTTTQDYPLATATSVQQTLHSMAEKMDADEDILFVYLSSHGSKDHQFNIDQPGLNLGDIGAEQLAAMVKSLPVKWKVIVVSACYAGGYIPHLQDDHTLVITAAAHDKKSFGCSDKNQFTYFGEALFKDALPQTNSFVEAFEKAKQIVTEREKENDNTPSEPQISQPEAIVEQLKSWRKGLVVEGVGDLAVKVN